MLYWNCIPTNLHCHFGVFVPAVLLHRWHTFYVYSQVDVTTLEIARHLSP